MATPTQQARETKARRPRDMALSMLVLIVPVFLVVAFYRYLGHETPPTVDTTEVYGSVQRAGLFQLLRPEGLPGGWRISSATFTDGVLRLGVNAPDDGALQVVESAKPPTELVPAVVGQGAKPGDVVTVGNLSWQRYTQGRPGEQALAQSTPPRTVIVVGQAKDAQLKQLAESLKAA